MADRRARTAAGGPPVHLIERHELVPPAQPELRFVHPPPDEPPFVQCRATAPCEECGTEIVGLASALGEAQAIARATGEHFERLALHSYSVHPCEPPLAASPQALGDSCIDLSGIRGVPTLRQTERVDPNREREWVWADDVGDGEPLLVPVEMMMLRYPTDPGLACREPLTTGACHHRDKRTAMNGAALELVERDAFMRAVLGESPPRRLPPGVDDELRELVERVEVRYRLEIGLFLLPGVIARPTVLAVMLDRSGVGPAVTGGLCCAANAAAAAEKAILEAWQPRVWLRREHTALGTKRSRSAPITSILDRGLHWYGQERLPSLSALWRAEPVPASELRELEEIEVAADDPVEELIAASVPLYAARLPIMGAGVCVRLGSAKLLPLFVDEKFSYVDDSRSIVPVPHFFL